MINQVFLDITVCVRCLPSKQRNTKHQDALWEEGKLAEVVWHFGQCSVGKLCLLPSIWLFLWHVPPVLTIVVDHAHHFMETVFPDAFGLFQQDYTKWWTEKHNNKFEVLIGLQISPNSQSNQSSVGCAGKSKSDPQRPHLTTCITNGSNGLAEQCCHTLQHKFV